MFINHLTHFTLINKWFIADTSAMDINHYVSADVSSVEPADLKLHYTHHSNMDTPHYVL